MGNAVEPLPDTEQTQIGSVRADKVDVVQQVAPASLPLPTGASTEATLALIKAKTDNLDVALSTRTKPADSQTVNGTVTANAGTGTFTVSLPPGASTDANLTSLVGTLDRSPAAYSVLDRLGQIQKSGATESTLKAVLAALSPKPVARSSTTLLHR